jgi:hypothetical protein
VRFGENWIADSEKALLLFEPVYDPMAYLPASIFDTTTSMVLRPPKAAIARSPTSTLIATVRHSGETNDCHRAAGSN